MRLSERAALITVVIVGAATSAAAMFALDSLPAGDQSRPVELRSSLAAIEPTLSPPAAPTSTGSLPETKSEPLANASPSTLANPNPAAASPLDPAVLDPHSDLPAADPRALRLTFLPPDAAPYLMQPSEEDWSSVVTEDEGQEESPEQNRESWLTRTRAAPGPGGSVTVTPPLSGIGSSALGGAHQVYRDRAINARLAQFGPAASERIAAKFKGAKAAWPPAEIALVAIKDEKTLELFARQKGGAWTFVHRYPVLAASGGSGPKLRKGDKQVPEGIYGIAFLNPNSRYHVSMRVNYPNEFDRKMAAKDGRRDLGGDIMIHGKRSSAGCLAMGDEVAEELFLLAATIGVGNIKIVIAPTDLRNTGLPSVDQSQPQWLSRLYMEVASAMSEFKAPPNTGTSSGSGLLSLLGL